MWSRWILKTVSRLAPRESLDELITEFPIDTVNTAAIQATVVAKDGLTLAVGGLIRLQRSRLEDKVPVLGDAPVVGTLFRRTEDVTQETLLRADGADFAPPLITIKGDVTSPKTLARVFEDHEIDAVHAEMWQRYADEALG